MAEEERDNGRAIESLYEQIETFISAVPVFYEFTTDGFQDIVHGISRVFGRKMHKGIILRRQKDSFRADISLSLLGDAPVLKTAEMLQTHIADMIKPYAGNLPVIVNIAVTDLVENRGEK